MKADPDVYCEIYYEFIDPFRCKQTRIDRDGIGCEYCVAFAMRIERDSLDESDPA